MLSPEIRLELPTGEVLDGTLRIRAGAYSLTLSSDPPLAHLDDAAGNRWADMFLGANVDTRTQADSIIYIGEPGVEPRDDCLRVTIPLDTTAWSAKRLVFDCFQEELLAWVEVEGDGDITDFHLFGGYYSGNLRLGTGFYRSGAAFASVVNPEPGNLERRWIEPGTSSSIDVLGSDVPGLRHWFFTPPPFCFLTSLVAGEDPSVLPEGPWMTMGLAVEPGEHNFTRFGYEAVDDGFSLRLAYEGMTSVQGNWRSPGVLFQFGAADPYAGIARYVESLEGRSLVPARLDHIRPSWWTRPIFCGWGAQSHLARDSDQAADAFATEAHYDGFLASLAERGVIPGTIVIDDKWQQHYGLADVDEEKWPDLAGWIAARHEREQRVLLWWKAWDAEGLPPELCVRDARGRALSADPSNPGYAELIADTMERLLGEDGLNADGFKVDFTARTPCGPGLSRHGEEWGVELLHRLLATLYAEAKRVKPDALIITHTPNPYFRTVTDMLRLNDVNTGHAVLPQMWHRARVVAAACPELLIDPDNWQMPDLLSWRNYLAVQRQIGVPSLYYATHVDLSNESFEEGDYAAIVEAWGSGPTT